MILCPIDLSFSKGSPMTTISRVLIYAGHGIANYDELKEEFDSLAFEFLETPPVTTGKGPYRESIVEDLSMIWKVNQLHHNRAWDIEIVYGEQLIDQLKGKLSSTLLIIPPGKSTDLDNVFTDEQIACIQTAIRDSGLNCLTHCGSSYWVSRHRHYETQHQTILKEGRINLFEGTARGPLSPKAYTYGADFYHEVVDVDINAKIGKTTVHILLSGGGTFIPDKSDQPMKVLATYSDQTLVAHQKDEPWKPCVISVPFGNGKVVLAMPIPASGSVDAEAYKKALPDSDVDWDALNKKISSEEVRMAYANSILAEF
jgi:glutamine amidotransferase-like uncharacterized protein